MNQRLREIYKQAFGYEPSPIGEPEIEAFAAALIEECREVLSEEYRQTPLECCGHFLRLDEAILNHFFGEEQ